MCCPSCVGKHSDFIAEIITTTSEDCILWPFGVGGNGYGATRDPDLGKQVNAMRRVLQLATGELGVGLYALHSCHVKLCVNPNHLRWGTPKDNALDGNGHGPINQGTRHGANRYSEDQIRQVRSTDGSRAALKAVAEELGMHFNYADLIWRRKRWAWLRARRRDPRASLICPSRSGSSRGGSGQPGLSPAPRSD